MKQVVRLLSTLMLLSVLIAVIACGRSHSVAPQSNSLSGNWEITLNAGASSPLVFTGFLIQSGNSLNGNLILALNCPGVGPITGTANGQNVSLNIDQFGDTISLTGTTVNIGAPISGDFLSESGSCNPPISGTWTAVPVAPIGINSLGSFHGTFTSLTGNGNVNVKGALSQGPNTGNSTATVSGTLAPMGAANLCPYLSPGTTITGLISGTAVSLNLYDENGAEYAQLGKIGGSPTVNVTPDGSTLSGTYIFPQLSASCLSDQGTFSLSFP